MDESDEIHDARELDRLVRFMTRKGRSFGLALATYADAEIAKAQRAVARARADATGVRVTAIELCSGEDDLIARLAKAGATNDVVFLTGLDEIAFDRTGKAAQTLMLTKLNLRRDELPQLVDARIVVWIAAEAYPQLAKLAWDLLDVMLTRFEFRRESPPRPPQGSSSELELFPTWPAPPGQLQASGEAQAASYARLAASSEDELTIADASASAGELYSSFGRLDLGKRWLEQAAGIYEQRAKGDRHLVVAATRTRLQLAHVLAAEGDVETARAQARRALALVDDTLTQREAGPARMEHEHARLSCLLALWHLGDPLTTAGQESGDDELLERWREGDSAAIRILFARHVEFVEAYLHLMAPELLGSEEIAGSVFVELLFAETPVEDVRATLFRTARVIASRFHTPLPPTTRSPSIQPTLEQLPPAAHDIIELHYVFGVPIEELAEMYGVVEATMHWRLASAARQLIETHAKRTGVQLSETGLRAAFAAKP